MNITKRRLAVLGILASIFFIVAWVGIGRSERNLIYVSNMETESKSVEDRKGQATAAIPIAQNRSSSEGIKNWAKSIGEIRELSLVVMPTKEMGERIEELLRNQDLLNHIKNTILKKEMQTEEHLAERTAAIDVIYEAFKSKDAEVLSNYSKLLEDIFTTEFSENSLTEEMAANQLFGDKVELALVTSKMFPIEFERIRKNVEDQNPNAKNVFKRARELSSVYQVSL